jgi:ATP-dependent exoDNAse (exonuclease V) alpha subunit
MAKEAVKAVQTLSGRSVIVLAPSSAAVETLKDSGFRGADTLANFQDKDYLKDRARGQILWIDEAGLLSAKQMRWAIDFASRNGCRVILSGDTRQHHSVERGDALRILERVGAVSQVVLTKIFRQLDPAQKAAIYDLSEGETDRGFDKLKDLGAIVEISDQAERLQKLSEKHLQALKDGVTSLIVTPTHEDPQPRATPLTRKKSPTPPENFTTAGLPEREVISGAGPIPVRQPRVRHRDKGRFSSAILPRYMRRLKPWA